MTLQNGERTFFHNRGTNAEFGYDDINFDNLQADLFHLGYLLLMDGLDAEDKEYGTVAAHILHDVQAKGICTSIDLVSDQSGRFEKVVPPSLKYCDYVVINEIEGGKLTGIAPRDKDGKINVLNLERICKKAFSFGIGKEIVLHCPELSCSMDKDEKFDVLPSLDLPKDYIVGAVGAGDAFCAGMLYSFVNGMDAVEGMKLASCAAACNLSVSDSVSGARNLIETKKLESLYRRKYI
jgi:sugar/nucleoside kinase (ribokinase family)